MQEKQTLSNDCCEEHYLSCEQSSKASDSAYLQAVSKELRVSFAVIKMQIEAIEDGMYDNNDFAFNKLRKKLAQFEYQINAIPKKS